MPLPIIQSLFQQIFGSSLPTASLARPTESSDEEGEDVVRRGPVISFQDVLTRQFLGPTILPKTIDTPSGKVFAPDDPIPAKPNILATYPPSKDQPWIMGSPMPTGEPQGLMGLPIPETQDKLKGFEKPQDVDTSVLMQNKITTWEKYFNSKEEFEKTAKENNITIEDLERSAIKKQITFKKKGIHHDIFFDGKLIGEIQNATKESGGDAVRGKYGDAYNISFIDSKLNYEPIDTVDGLNYAKDMSKNWIAVGLLDKTYENSLANLFPNIKYDKKGKPIEYLADEKIETEYLNKLTNALDIKNYSLLNKERNYDFEDSILRSEDFKSKIEKITPRIIDFLKEVAVERDTSNPVGSLIDKPLPDE